MPLSRIPAELATTPVSFRNRIINGDMRINQRNAGASVTPASSAYTLDRWQMDIGLASRFSVQQVADAPAGFTSSVRLTVVSSFTQAASSAMFFRQSVEGLNVSDLAWGTANAVGVTVSFWVKASVTGTYSFAIGNNANNYHYIATYTVATAGAWQYVSVTIPAPTAGTWLTDTNAGLRLKFDLGSATSFNSTAGSWQAADVARTSGSVVLGSTASATWQITGVQLEAGSVATPFERRDYGRELIMCQRYYETGATKLYLNISATLMAMSTEYKVTKRAAATLVYSSPPAGGYAPPTAQEWSDINGFAGNRNSTQELAYSWAASAEL